MPGTDEGGDGTPYAWAFAMRRTVGGSILTVDDFIHGSLSEVPECASHVVACFDTGSPDGVGCAGERLGPTPPPAPIR